MINKVTLKSLPGLFFMLGCIYSSACFAGCRMNSSVRSDVNFGTVYVQRDVAVGSTIASIAVPPTMASLAHCDPGAQYLHMVYYGGRKTGMRDVFSTNIQGVGIRGKVWGAYPLSVPPSVQHSDGSTTFVDNHNHQYELVKIGNITSGRLSGGEILRVTYDGGGLGLVHSVVPSNITQLSCSISGNNLQFPIGNVLLSHFKNRIGSTPDGATVIKNLQLNCDPQANINITLRGTQNPDVYDSSVLALTGQGNSDVARGVGVQLLYHNTPLTFNNRIHLKRSAGGQELLPITARYYQTRETVSAGKANASATLDLTYQ
ncbi:fimbrial protein [Enterobacter wuhouensis]|uniref:fimbrial protein n=1 Tax=Enterobacter wuhouensis TaxID=2529381 RepID=UPI002FCF857A